ncbi:MAG: hypothetical protein QOD26_1203 [Betaproteobacteria bacterium]|jgi:hypothetical protein|nr:hypothetical protein [Betaproteobacteria bacterium]
MDAAICTILIGTGATAVMDAWMLVRTRVLGVPAQSYGLVGRWLAGMARGQFRHERIAASPAVRGELLIGWTAHYLTGITFAALLLAIRGLDWARYPTLAPALLVGIGSVAAPFLLMQPGMGAGIAASRAPRPGAARLQSLVTHTVFGFGLYAAGWLVALSAG